MKHFILLLLVCLTGCMQPVVLPDSESKVQVDNSPENMKPAVDHLTVTWTISDQFTDNEIANILTAADAWRISTKGRVDLKFQIAEVPERADFTMTREDLTGCCGGITNDARNQIAIFAEYYPDTPCVGRLWHIAAHELGHTFGINHGGDGVMRDHKPDCNAHFTQSDLELFAEANR